MKISYLQKPEIEWNEKIPESKEHPRSWKSNIDLEITLSDGYVLFIPKGTVWDGASVPKWLWWLFPPIDEGKLGDFIHDELWKDKQGQLEYFKYDIYDARKFADDERKKWREEHAPDKKIFNFVSNLVIRLIGGFFYSRQLNIPN